MGGVYRIQTFLDFYIFFIFTRPLSKCAIVGVFTTGARNQRRRPAHATPTVDHRTLVVWARLTLRTKSPNICVTKCL